MAIISFDKDVIVDYTPEFSDNKDAKDPCMFGIKPLGNGKINEYAKQMTSQIAAKSKGIRPEKIASIQAEVLLKIQKKQFVDNITYVKNYPVIGADGKTTFCEDVGKVYDIADQELIKELIKAMESASALSEGQIKN